METKIKKPENIRHRNFYLYTKTNELRTIFLYYRQKKRDFFHSAVCNPVSEKLYSPNI